METDRSGIIQVGDLKRRWAMMGDDGMGGRERVGGMLY